MIEMNSFPINCKGYWLWSIALSAKQFDFDDDDLRRYSQAQLAVFIGATGG